MTHWQYTGLEYVFQQVNLSGLPHVCVVRCGFNYLLALTSEGHVYYMGNNSYVSRALHVTDEWRTLAVPFTAHVTQVSAGWSHVIFLTDTGEVYSAGRNHVGQCGTGGTDTSHVTRLNLTGVIQCAAGDCHSLFLDQQGRVYGSGTTQYGQLGSAFPDLDNHVLGDAVRTPQLLGDLPPMRSVAAGACHSLLIDRSGHAWSMGWNGYKQLARTGSEHVPALVESFQLDEDSPITVEVEHVIGALWSSVFVTRCRRVFVAGWCHVTPLEQVVHVTPHCIYESRARVSKNSLRVTAGRNHVLIVDEGQVHQFGLFEHTIRAEILAATYFGAISRTGDINLEK